MMPGSVLAETAAAPRKGVSCQPSNFSKNMLATSGCLAWIMGRQSAQLAQYAATHTRDALRTPNPPRTAPCSRLMCNMWHKQFHVPSSCNLAYSAT